MGYEVIEKIRVQCDTLDNQLHQHQIPDVDFIKIDAQGHELAVLQGARKSLAKAIGLEVEVEFLQVYQNQPLFADIDQVVRGAGFDLFDLEKSYFKRKAQGYYGVRKGQVIYGIALYFVSPERLFERGSLTEGKVMNTVLAYAAYSYFDAAEVVIRLGREHRILSEHSARELEAILRRFRHRFRVPNFKGRQRVHRAFAKITRAFGGEGVNFSDMGVGNF